MMTRTELWQAGRQAVHPAQCSSVFVETDDYHNCLRSPGHDGDHVSGDYTWSRYGVADAPISRNRHAVARYSWSL